MVQTAMNLNFSLQQFQFLSSEFFETNNFDGIALMRVEDFNSLVDMTTEAGS
jgi:hypothetical protein